MSQFFSKYQGGGPSAVPAGFMQAASQSGQNIAAGLEKFGEGIANYRKNKREKRQAEAIFEDLASREDPDIVNFSIDPKRLQKLQDGKGTTEDYLVAANSIRSKISEIDENKKEMESKRRFDEQQQAMMDRFNKTEKRLQQDSDRREEQYQTQLTEKNAAIESFRILHTPSTVPDPEQYTSAMHKAKMDSKYNDFVALESMSQEQIDEQFSRPESLLEKAEKAMNVEGISPEQIQNIYDIANQHSDTKLVIQEDDVTGYRVFVSPKTGSVTSAGVNPEKAGEKLTEGDKNRAFRVQMEKVKMQGRTRENIRKFQLELMKAKALLAKAKEEVDEDEEAEQNANIAFLSTEINNMKKEIGMKFDTPVVPNTASESTEEVFEYVDGKVVPVIPEIP